MTNGSALLTFPSSSGSRAMLAAIRLPPSEGGRKGLRMKRDVKSRARVERLLRGDDFRPDDMTNLLLYLRDYLRKHRQSDERPIVDVSDRS
jgi:hypothetical protein